MILDYYMSGMNGLQVIKGLKKEFAKKKVPMPKVIVISSIKNDTIRKKILTQADLFLPKNFNLADL